MNPLGKYCQKIRLDAGLSQNDVAREMGLTTAQFISSIERGIVVPSPLYIYVISRLADTSATAIIDKMAELYKNNLTTKVKGFLK